MVNESFNERPKANEKKRALAYISKLLDDARKDKNKNQSDIVELEEVQRLLNIKRYGLVWEEHAEKVEEEMKTKIPIFVEDEHKKITDNPEKSDYNFLLEGDNLHSLHLLEKTHANSIDIIYIDPPYNTGHKDFIYNDDYVEKEDNFSHSKWLSFMKRRLELAKSLLKKDGVIFISIDNKEGYQLKLLLDEIFGFNNMAADIHVETSAVAGPRRYAAVNGSVVKTAEFVFAYTSDGHSNIIKQPMYDSILGYDTHYSLFWDEKNNVIEPLIDWIKNNELLSLQFTNAGLKINMPSLNKLMYVNPILRDWIYKKEISSHIFRQGDVISIDDNMLNKLSQNKIMLIDGKYVTLNKKDKPIVLFRYLDRLGVSDDYTPSYGERTIRGNLWKGFSADGGNLASEGGITFKNGKKPKRLIKQLIKSATDMNSKDIIVLDFFAGSGTTGQAVMELDSESNGNYHFILATNEEVIETTYQRMLNVSKDTPMNLKYFKTFFVSKDDEDIENELLDNVKTLVELQWGVDLTSSSIRIVTTLAEAKSIELKGLTKVYMRAQVHSMLTQEQVTKYNQTGVTIYDIPESYFSKELREQGL
ncbi:site-specific DNA-methyltransferase [Leuconostoc pseudomesenteroides]|uniref:site-specific DNA-methyltransferase n=1 Tax=Leuconostoc pseudomesenteroides TaxID=33968 RepID=UPI0032DE579A